MKTYPWYLPLSEPLAVALKHGEGLDVADLCRYQSAAILYLLHLPKLPAKSPDARQRDFARLLARPTATLKTFLAQDYAPADFARGLAHAQAVGIELMDINTVQRQPFTHPDGSWNFDFAQQHRLALSPLQHAYERPGGLIIRLSDQQLRLVHTIRANLEDSIEAQAHAGTGKTFVLEQVLELMPKGQCLFLADVDPKLKPVNKRFGDRVATSTFKQLAEHLLCGGNQLRKARMLAASRVNMTYTGLAEQAGLGAIGRRSAAQVAALCWKIIAKFCETRDTAITAAHLPNDQVHWIPQAERPLLALTAEKLWFKMTYPHDGAPRLPVKGYHRIKQMMLEGLFVPQSITMIIIDEGHDLTPAMVDFLNRSPQTVITLGDPLQNLAGRYVAHDASIRHREMTLSLRCGPSLVDYVNDLIELFPEPGTLPFTADKTRETVISSYCASRYPVEPCVILVADEWGLFDWLIRSRDEAQGAAVVDWDFTVEGFMEDCLNLCLYGQPARHGLIARYPNWAQLSEAMSWNEAFIRVERWLQTVGERYGVSGLYRRAELAEFAAAMPMRPLLATVFTAKNFELPHMALSEDLYYFAHLKGKRALSSKLALLYTAITRTCGKIQFPDTHQERMRSLVAATGSTIG